MTARMGTALAISTGAATVAAVLALAGEPSRTPAARATAAGTESATPASPPATRLRRAREDCSRRSEANFPGGFTSPDNLVVGPLVLVGGAYTDPGTVRRFGGDKFPVLVKAGHAVTVRIGRLDRGVAGLAYGPLPQGQTTRMRDTYRSVTFVACRPGRASDRSVRDGPSGSYADGVSVTFWSGFVLTRAPACIPLDVYVDGADSPRRVGLALGRRCDR